jgi:archaellum biogenesis ATPase FlaH
LSDFEKWCKTNNITLMLFNSTNDNIVLYIEFIKQLSDDKKLIKIVSEYETYIDEKNVKGDAATSMRMTFNEF